MAEVLTDMALSDAEQQRRRDREQHIPTTAVSKTNDGLKYQGRHILDRVEILAAAGHALLSNGKFDALRSLSDENYT